MLKVASPGYIASAFQSIVRMTRQPWYRRIAALAGVLYLLIYLYSLRHILWIPESALGGLAPLAIEVADAWPTKLWKAIAPFAFEPVVAIYLGRRLALLLAAPNLLLGLALGALVGLNVAMAVAHFQGQRECRRPRVGLLGTLPSLLTGFTCCVPTVALALGANSVLALIALRSYFVPISFLLLGAGLFWGAGHIGVSARR